MIKRIRRTALKLIDRYTTLQPQIRQKSVWYGNKHTGFYLNPDLLDEHAVVYSIGIGEDSSFDEAVISQIGCHVFAFDPTPKSISWVKKKNLPARFHFFEVGLSAQSGVADFYLPINNNHVSGSIHSHSDLNSSEKITVNVKTLSDLVQQLGHERIDVLKMDIEGAEYEVIENILSEKIPINQLLIEFHARFFNDGRSKTRDCIRRLNQHGYRIFAASNSGQEVSFICQHTHR